jgi:general secretion pathway protein A
MYKSYFGFREEPFSITPDPRFFYANPGHEEAYASLLYGIRQRKGYISLIGEAGTGKTTLLRRVVSDLERPIRVAFYYYNTTLTFDEFLDFICTSFGLQVKDGRKLEKIQAIDRFLRERLAEGGTGVLIIDEAHHLADEVLENLRLLSNIELDNHKLLQIVLVGQPELEKKLDRPELRQLKQRIAVSCRLGCLKPQAVEPFIHHRMQTAGCQRYDVFTPQAIKLIATRSEGIPRIINTICDNCLSIAYQTSQQNVSEQIVEKVTTDLRLQSKPPPSDNGLTLTPKKKQAVIRLSEEARGAGIATANGAPAPHEIWVGERPWNWTQQLPWIGAGTITALFLLYLGNSMLFSPSSPGPESGSITLAQARTPALSSQKVPPAAPATAPTPVLPSTATTTQSPSPTSPSASPIVELNSPPSQPTTAASQEKTEQPPTAMASLTPEPTSQAETSTPSSAPSPVASTVAPRTSEPNLPQAAEVSTAEKKGQEIIISRGDTVSDLVLKVYGNYNALALDLIKDFNPEIADLDRILIGQRILLPSISRDTLLRKQNDGTYQLILGTFPTETAAQKAAQEAREKGYNVKVNKRRIAGSRSFYRVEIEKIPDTAAADRAWKLVEGSKS